MSLRQDRVRFTADLAHLLLAIPQLAPGLEVAIGRDGEKHMTNSLHYDGLAKDLALYSDGTYVSDGDAPIWTRIGELWESYGPGHWWGGKFNDSNHFSYNPRGDRK